MYDKAHPLPTPHPLQMYRTRLTTKQRSISIKRSIRRSSSRQTQTGVERRRAVGGKGGRAEGRGAAETKTTEARFVFLIPKTWYSAVFITSLKLVQSLECLCRHCTGSVDCLSHSTSTLPRSGHRP